MEGAMDDERIPLAVLISGRGSNMQAIVGACRRGEIPARVVLVLSNRADSAGIAWAAEHGIETRVVSHRGFADRESHDRAVVAHLRGCGARWICLAGYMRLLSPWFVDEYENRILNIHPSLLPSFPGLHAQKQAFEHGVRWSGCTVHLVDAKLDHGPIVAQTAVPVEDGDGVEDLEGRILAQEHATYVRALSDLLTRSWELDGRRVVFAAPQAP
jgi:phosphoribosylglycinamide formyltransferase-1